MFTIRKKFEINTHEIMDFVRLLGRFGLKFKVSDEYIVKDENDKPNARYRCFIVFGTRKQIGELLDARDIIAEYHKH
jgi:hypothetical protein